MKPLPKKSSVSSLDRVITLVKLSLPYAHAWVVALMLMIVFTLCNTVSVMGLIPLIDKVLSNKPIKISLSIDVPFQQNLQDMITWLNGFSPLVLLRWICIIVVIMVFLKGVAQFFQHVLMEWVSQKISKDLRMALFKKYFLLPGEFFTGRKTGELISRVTNDVLVIQNVYSGNFTNTIMDSLHFFPFLAIVLVIEWKMALFCLIIIPLSMAPIIIVGRQIRKISKKNQENVADLTSMVHEILGNLKIVKIFGQFNRENEKFSAVCEKTIKVRVKAQRKQAVLSPATEMMGVLAGVLLLWKFSPKVLSGDMSLGTFLTYFTCIACMIKPIKTMGKIQVMLQNALGGLDRVIQVLDLKESDAELDKGGDIQGFKQEIRFDHLSFSYKVEKTQDKKRAVEPEFENFPVLSDISFTIKRGEIVALVGPSGSGKTTIAHLIPRFFDATSGLITIDGRPLKDLKVSSLRNLIGYVSQEPVLFHTTVRENIAYGKPSATQEEIEQVARLARAHDFIMQTEKGYDTTVGERGVRLSGGEKQRIAIARALLRNPEIFIFDEATSALDTENEKMVQEAIDQVMKDRTTIVIAHRLSTIVKADKIVVLENGKIVEMGDHLTLLQQQGLYKKLYEMSFSG